ncbi:MAG: carotenoid biosynthesis protein [Gammaproteobacteria bacterium]
MIPSFEWLMTSGVTFAAVVLAYLIWRFGAADAISFAILSGGFCAILDFLSSFGSENYVYPGQSRLWVFTYIFFGWIAMGGLSLLIAEGILCRGGEDMLTQRRYLWQVPLLTAIVALSFDLFIDPVAVAAGYWIWLKEANVYYGIPLLNFVGWFVLMGLAPFGWILIARQRTWGAAKKALTSILAMVPLAIMAVGLSVIMNSAVAVFGLK